VADNCRVKESHYGDIVAGVKTPVMAKHTNHFGLRLSISIGASTA
jgi:hypothetical protein